MLGKTRSGHRHGIQQGFRRVLVVGSGVAVMAGAVMAPAIAVPIGAAAVDDTQSDTASTPLTLAVSPTRLELVATDSVSTSQTVSVRATGGEPGTITIELRDAVIDDSGGWRLIAAGSTPNGLQDVLRITPSSFPYEPAATPRSFRPTVALLADALDRPRFGALVVTFTPSQGANSQAGGVIVQGAVAMQVIAAPSAATLDDAGRASSTRALRLELDQLSVHQNSPWTFVDRVLPNLPGLVGHGPATIRVHGTNTGDTVLDTRVVYRIYRRNPLTVLPFVDVRDRPTLVIRQRPRFLIGGQTLTDEVSTRQQPQGAAASDGLPFIGLVRVEATLTGSVAGLQAAPVTRSQTFVVLPWGEILVAFGVFLGWRWGRERRRRRRNAARRKSDQKRSPAPRKRLADRRVPAHLGQFRSPPT